MDTDWNCKKMCKNKRVTLKGGWPMIGIAKRVQKSGLCIKERVTNDMNCPKKCKNKRVYALRGRWTIIGIAKKSAKKRGFMH